MTTPEAIQHLYNLSIHGKALYHPGYDWTVEYAKSCKAHFGGVKVNDYLAQYTRRESRELFDQRKVLTKHVQKSFGATLSRPFEKVSRSNWTKVLAFDGDEKGEIAQDFQRSVLGRFTNKGLDRYTFERLFYWTKYDPNAFIVVEFQSTDGRTKARPYPFEVRADMAVDFKYGVHGDLEYLAVRQVHKKPDGKNTMKEVERLTMYMPAQTVVIQQLTESEKKAAGTIPAKSEMVGDPVDGQLLNTGDKVFIVQIPIPHPLEVTPAIRVGYVENPEDDGQTRVSVFDPALPWAEKMVKTNSEFDLTAANLAFPISARYTDDCDMSGCVTGKLPDGSTCTECQGTGKKRRPTSAMEEIEVSMPRDPQDIYDLSKLLHYFAPPVEAVKLQIEMLQMYAIQGKEALFNSQMYTKQETAQTATFHNIELQAIYDTLYPYAQNAAGVWKFIATACKEFTGTKGQMTAALKFPHDFRFETADDLFDELKRAREAEANNGSTAFVNRRIMEVLLKDEPEALSRWRVDDSFDPFSGMTETQIVFALQSDMVPEWKKVWWINKADIMAEILEATPAFYSMAAKAQREMIRTKVDELVLQLEAAKPVLNLGGNGVPQMN